MCLAGKKMAIKRVNHKNGEYKTQINTQNYSKFEENMFRSSKPDVPE